MSDCHSAILTVLSFSPKPLAAFEIVEHPLIFKEWSENDICSRFCEAPLKGKVWWAWNTEGRRYKLWWDRPFTDEHRQEELLKQGCLL